jgi:hypothetical protein
VRNYSTRVCISSNCLAGFILGADARGAGRTALNP